MEMGMGDRIYVALGVGFVGITVGYMAGGSASPVASVAIPAVFGLVVTAVGLLQAVQPNKDYVELVRTYGEEAKNIPEIAEYRSRARAAPANVGIALMVFCIFYLSAATFGAKVRIEGLLVTKSTPPAFPWAKSATTPPTIESALEWIALQSRLRSLGYEDQRIQSLYEIQVLEWQTLVATKQRTPDGSAPAKLPSSAASGVRLSSDELLKQWHQLPEVMRGHPFANQPPKELRDKLNGTDGPSVGQMKG